MVSRRSWQEHPPFWLKYDPWVDDDLEIGTSTRSKISSAHHACYAGASDDIELDAWDENGTRLDTVEFDLELISAVTLWKENLAITPHAKRSIVAVVNAYFSRGDESRGDEGSAS